MARKVSINVTTKMFSKTNIFKWFFSPLFYVEQIHFTLITMTTMDRRAT